MSDMLSIAASGVRAYQSALTTTSENIANAGTLGYARRAAALGEVNASDSSLLNGGAQAGQGVLVTGIDRAADAFRNAEVRTAGSDLARTEAGLVWLERIEGALTASKLDERLAAFFNAGQNLAADPAASGLRAVMLEQAAGLASAFRSTGAALEAAGADLTGQADATVGEINSLAKALGTVNSGLGRTGAGSAGHAGLLDERDRLLEQMSVLVDVGAEFDAAGRATLRIGGPSGPVLVAGDEAGSVTFATNSEGAASIAVHRAGERANAPVNGGELAGIIDGAQRIAAARSATDTIAAQFVAGVNAVQAGGRDPAGNPGAAMFAGETAASVTMVLADPKGIAAAGVGAGPRDNGNLKALADLRTSGGFETTLTDMVVGNGAAISGRRSVAQAQSAIQSSAVASRDSISGVNLDEEAVNLMRFQQAYQASSRVIQVARETIQSILDIR
ncbi:flagellar hook-associated protein FlgK [Sphingomonas qomolangmaensis]|uniref:Flagellar hook-associated protein 1 n=1 Tax=Sphingomonas qomolangmaensis TaxID=2918765 RepID=A0ABY5L892_9SPHN|nr:flagellar hook-associated protein FlgK [Sphingomonas qomolangmaensis]UUL82283.1 flagellar hook-associated protein FlgK [Sphingomonas qomolangmaensis]